MSVAETILAQLGGRKFTTMTGAKHFIGDGNSLTLRLPSRFAKNGINVVKITLTPADEYDIVFSKLWGTKLTFVSECKGVYCDQLQEIFTEHTGLDTHL